MDTQKVKDTPGETFDLSLRGISIKSLKHEVNIYQEILNFLPSKEAKCTYKL